MLHSSLWLFPAVLPNHVSVAAALYYQTLWQMELCFSSEMVARVLYCPQHIAMWIFLGSLECLFWVAARSDQACLFGILHGFASQGCASSLLSSFKLWYGVGLQCMDASSHLSREEFLWNVLHGTGRNWGTCCRAEFLRTDSFVVQWCGWRVWHS